MKIGIIGKGGIGSALAKQLTRAGHEVASVSRTEGSIDEVAAADIVVLAVPWSQIPVAVARIPSWEGRILVDPTNPIEAPHFRVADLHGRTSSETVAALASGARVVKAFNTLPPHLLAAEPRVGDGRRVVFLSGDDADANTSIGTLAESMGFAPVILGGLVEGGRMQQFPSGPLPALNLIRLG